MILIGDQLYLTAEEILTAGAQNSSSNILTTIDNYAKDIKQLLSEVKWLYKYGGSGTGKGGSGGGGSSTDSSGWYIRVTLNGTIAANDSIAKLPSEGVYSLGLSVFKHGGSYYSYTINNGSTETITGSFSSTDNKNYQLTINLNCNKNSNVFVTVFNDAGEPKEISFSYIVNSFIGNIELVSASGSPLTNTSEILLSAAQDNIYINFGYSAALPVTVNFEVTDFNGKVTTGSANCSLSGNSVFLEASLEGLTLNKYLPAYSEDISKPTTYIATVKYTVLDENEVEIQSGEKVMPVSIIPNTLFLSCYSDSVVLKDTAVTESDSYIGAKPIIVTVYEGNYILGRSYKFYYKFYKADGTLIYTSEEATLGDREARLLTFACLSVGGYYATFYVKNVNSTLDYQYSRTIYWAVKEADLSYSWMPDSTMENNTELATINYYRAGTSKGGFSAETGNYIEMSAASAAKEYTLDTNILYSGMDMLFSMGVLTNEINDEDSPLVLLKSFDANGLEESAATISIYLDKFMLGENLSSKIFIPREETINKTNTSKYHLITLYKRYMESSGSDNYYEYVLYVDGIIELGLSSWSRNEAVYNKCIICPSNIIINYLEVDTINSRISLLGLEAHVNEDTQYSDLDIAKHFYTYKALILGQISDPELIRRVLNLSALSSFKWLNRLNGKDISRVEVDNLGAIIDLGKTSGVATMILEVLPLTKYFKLNLFDWMDLSYSSELAQKRDHITDLNYTSSNSIDCIDITGIQYLEAGAETPLEIIIESDCEYIAEIQGTSTRDNKSKNLELELSLKDLESTADVPLFSPNYDPEDGNTYLPELSYTLKSDVVDSSHSNNTCLGDFFNDHTTRFITAATAYGTHIKQCLKGFPILLYFKVPESTTVNKYYFLGIYNFNLGRKSSYNLGYKDASVFLNAQGLDTLAALRNQGSFILTRVDSNKFNNYLNGLSVAEVLEKSDYFDFSLFGSRVLFNLVNPMFGDFVPKLTDTNRTTIQSLVLNISRAGGYIFEQLGKNFGPISDAYHGVDKNGIFKNLVPDYTVQYTRPSDNDNENRYTVDTSVTVPSNLSTEAGTALLSNLLKGDDENVPLLNYLSAVEYYLGCMAFGLVDSVIKNLNLKSFLTLNINGVLRAMYYLAFYDMDTSFNLGNQAESISYFAFSDYWHAAEGTEDVIQVTPTECSVYRDFYPIGTLETGYDVPSSYLFAIAKYAKIFLSDLTTSPRELWAEWRAVGGPLETADIFLNNYFNNHLANINELIFNLNYRTKYFVPSRSYSTQSVALNANTLVKLNGRRVANVRNWLTKRFRILDAFFELDGNVKNIYKLTYDKDTNEVETNPNGTIKWTLVEGRELLSINPPNNEDCKYYDTIFTSAFNTSFTCSAQKDVAVGIQAKDYTPSTLILASNSRPQYMFTNSKKTYVIKVNASSNFSARAYGSYYWTKITNIIPFVGDGNQLTLRTPYLKNLEGTTGYINGITLLQCYSLENISLTGAEYKGSLSLSNLSEGNAAVAYPLLRSITLNNNSIDLTANNLYISSLDIANKKGGTITVKNGTLLSNVVFLKYLDELDSEGNPILTTLKSDRVEIDTYSQKTTTLTNLAIQTLVLVNTHPEASITITGDSTLKNLTLTGFKLVHISDCPNISTLNLNGVEELVLHDIGLETLNLVGCPNISTVNVANCTNMTKVLVRQEVRAEKLSSMNISNTKISTLCWVNSEGVEVDKNGNPVSTPNTGVIDLIGATGLVSSTNAFACSYNSGVKTILFDNTADNLTTSPYLKDNLSHAVRIGTFHHCENLERIYGNIIVTSSNAFNACPKFSIHGTNLSSVRYNNKAVLNNLTVYMPYLLHTSNVSVIPQSKYFDGGTECMDVYFQSGDSVTNMSFDISSFNQTFRSTAVTLWDVNYIFSNASKVSDRDAYVGFSQTFSYISGANNTEEYQIYGGGADNRTTRFQNYAIPRYWLHNVKLSEFTQVFMGNSTSTDSYYKRIYSATSETQRDGTFDPIFSATTNTFSWEIENGWHVPKLAVDKNFFRGAPNSITAISKLSVYLVPEDFTTNVFVHSESMYSTTQGFGDATGFFSQPALSNLSSLSHISFVFLNFSTLTIPDSVRTLDRAIYCTYGTGELNMNNIFTENSLLYSIINNSFTVSNANANAGSVKFLITNDTFKNLSTLRVLGNNTTTFNGDDSQVDKIFGGSGMLKVVDVHNFPYDVFKNKNLETINGFFWGTIASDASTDAVELPGDLFKNTTTLKNLPYTLAGIRFYHMFTGNGFINNTILTNVTGLCYYGKYYLMLGNTNYLQGGIPLNFFKVGNNLRTITNASGCFAGGDWATYTNLNPTSVEDFDGVHGADTYGNLDEMYNETAGNLSYKVIYVPSTGYGTTNNAYTYCCPPNLLRQLNTNCNVSYLFYHCGNRGTNGEESSISGGLNGRIPPYLFLGTTIKNASWMFAYCNNLSLYYTDVVMNEANTFPTSYKAHLIPLTLFTYGSVTSMEAMFAYCQFSYAEDLSKVFKVSRGLNTSRMFHGVRWINSVEGRTTGSTYRAEFNYETVDTSGKNGLFSVAPSNITGMFSQSWDSHIGGPSAQYIEIGIVLDNSLMPNANCTELFYGYSNAQQSGGEYYVTGTIPSGYISAADTHRNYHYYNSSTKKYVQYPDVS